MSFFIGFGDELVKLAQKPFNYWKGVPKAKQVKIPDAPEKLPENKGMKQYMQDVETSRLPKSYRKAMKPSG